MATEKYRVKMLCNLGWLDMEKYKLPAALEDEVIEVDERQMNVLVGVLKCAVPADGETPAHLRRQSHATELEGAEDRRSQMQGDLESKMEQRAETRAAERRRQAAAAAAEQEAADKATLERQAAADKAKK